MHRKMTTPQILGTLMTQNNAASPGYSHDEFQAGLEPFPENGLLPDDASGYSAASFREIQLRDNDFLCEEPRLQQDVAVGIVYFIQSSAH